MSSLADLVPDRQRFLLARLLGHEAVERCRGVVDERLLHAIREDLDLYTRFTLGSPTDPGVGPYLRALPDALRRRADPANGAAAHQVAGELDALVGVALKGGTDPVGAMHDAVLVEALRFYSEAGVPRTPEEMRFRVLLQLAGATHELATDVMVNGYTNRRSVLEIQIHLSAETLGYAEFRAIPYVLFHEAIVHALAAPEMTEAQDYFAEGWMDFVAAEVHGEALRGSAVPGGTALGMARPQDTEDYGDSLYRARYRPDSPGRGHCNKGRDAARLVQDGLRAICGAAEGRRQFWCLSAAINAIPMAPVDRDDLVESLEHSLRGGADSQVAGALRRFVARDAGAVNAAHAFAQETSAV